MFELTILASAILTAQTPGPEQRVTIHYDRFAPRYQTPERTGVVNPLEDFLRHPWGVEDVQAEQLWPLERIQLDMSGDGAPEILLRSPKSPAQGLTKYWMVYSPRDGQYDFFGVIGFETRRAGSMVIKNLQSESGKISLPVRALVHFFEPAPDPLIVWVRYIRDGKLVGQNIGSIVDTEFFEELTENRIQEEIVLPDDLNLDANVGTKTDLRNDDRTLPATNSRKDDRQ